MKKLLSLSLLSIAAVLSPRAHAQLLCALGAPTPAYDPMADMPPSAGAQGDLKKAKSLLCPKGCGKVLLFANATTPNTATVTDGKGVSKIAYSPSFVGSIQSTYGPIATFGIFAHDLGHHLEATGTRAAWMKDSWDAELRADAWAGCAMAKAALTPSRLQAFLLALSTYPSPHHPDWTARRPVITDGYTGCGGRMLPPLAKESADQGAKIDGSKDVGKDTSAAVGTPSGCAGDKDCRNGRMCLNARCGPAPERRRCGKDTDCPEPQECAATGFCGGSPNQSQAQAPEKEKPQETSEPAEAAKPAGPMLAALQAQHPPTPAAGDAPAASCPRACDEVRNQCVQAATSEANKCQAAIQSDASYRSCSCPNYPAGSVGCYQVCANAYERGKSCSATTLVRDCRADGDRCRSQCQ